MATAEYTAEQREKKRQYYLSNKAAVLEKRKARYYRDVEASRDYARKYSSIHPLTTEQKESQRARSKAWYFDNREANLEKAKAYHKANPEIGKKAMKKYCEANRELLRKRSREFYRNNWEKERTRVTISQHVRRAQQKETQVDLKGIKVWMSEIRTKPFVRCHWCGTKVIGKKVHFDHIVALAKKGTHTIGNLCASCADCNHRKSARAISDWIVGGQTFLSL